MLADEQLMRLVRRADSGAFSELYQRHSGAAYALALRLSATSTAAEDLVQDAFLAVWRSGATYDAERGSVRSWVLTVVRNGAVDAARRSAARPEGHVNAIAVIDWLEAPDDTELEVAQREIVAVVRAAVASLPDEQLQVIVLAYFRGFTHTEIATILATPLGTVKGRLRLALAKLQCQVEGR